ncbi:hypothetical protein [Collimonas fungivorans]|nr:hypothetical protein [Collimonas fungivorans]
MIDDPRTKPLQDWNRLSRENAENAIISSMLEVMPNASEPLDSFSTWLLVAAAAVGSFLITNADKLLPMIQHVGFLTCGAFLCCSCFFGLLSKMAAVKCKIGKDLGNTVRTKFAEHFARFREEEKKIKEGAEFWGITLETGIRLERIMKEFFSALPAWASWLANRQLKKYEGNPQVGYLIQVKNFQWQGAWALLQALSFLGFLASGFYFAAAA